MSNKIQGARNQKLEKLRDGIDSGNVPEKTKVNLFAKQIGICAAPDCDRHIHDNKTRLGECAHIIPRKVGSHPREDYETPLENRKLENNLLYLCTEHHKLIDNKELSNQYPTDLLRQWKIDHENWASQVSKKTTNFPLDLQDQLQNALNQITEGAEHSNNLVSKLLDVCHENIIRGQLQEANALFSQVKLLLGNFNDPKFLERAKIIEALLDYKKENIHEAKKKLLEILNKNTEAHNATFEYIDICEAAPEPGDNAYKYEQIVQTLYPNHPRLEMLAAVRACRSESAAKENTLRAVPDFDGHFLELYFLIQKSIVFNIAQDFSRRDEFVDRALQNFPLSSTPHIFKLIFKFHDTLQSNPSKEALLTSLNFYEEQKKIAEEKGNLTRRNLLNCYFHEFLIKDELLVRNGFDLGFSETAEKAVKLLLECFADQGILSILFQIILRIHLPQNHYIQLLEVLEKSNVIKNNELLEQILIQGIPYVDLYEKTEHFLRGQNNIILATLLKDLQDHNIKNISKKLDEIGSTEFSLAILNTCPDKEFALKLAANLRICNEAKQNYDYTKVILLAETNNSEEAIRLMDSMNIDLLTSLQLEKLANISYQSQTWDLLIRVGNKLLPKLNTQKHKLDLWIKLAFAYHKVGDDSKTIEFCENALTNHQDMLAQNVSLLLCICAESYYKVGNPNKSYEIFAEYDVQSTWELKITEAQYALKTNKKDKLEIATKCVLEGFSLSKHFDDRIFVSAYEVLNNVNQTSNELELGVAVRGSYVKLEGIGWIYLGPTEKAFGATPLESGESFDSIIGKTISNEISWPPDKFSSPGTTRKIIYIVNEIGYLTARAQEGLHNLAKLGTEPIWSVQALKENGELNVENLTAFLRNQEGNINEVYEKYVANVIPFGFLAAAEGSIARAITRIASEQKGFIRCNDGTKEDIQRQSGFADRVLNGSLCVIDGLSAFILAESDLMDVVLSQIPRLSVPISVISELRKLASCFDPTSSSVGRAGLVGGEFRFFTRSHEREQSLYSNLLNTANKLDTPDKKTIVPNSRRHNSSNFLRVVPKCLSEPIYSALDQEAFLLTDDHIMLKAFEHAEKTSAPNGFSTFSLIEKLHAKGHISLEDYLRFFSLLASYRYQLLPISVGGMIDAVLPKSTSGVILFQPKNIENLCLGLTLSLEYGVSETISIRILSLFFINLITDDTVPDDVCETIFEHTIVSYSMQRENRFPSELIKIVVEHQLKDSNWLTGLAIRKHTLLNKQLKIFSETFDPILKNIPTLSRDRKF